MNEKLIKKEKSYQLLLICLLPIVILLMQVIPDLVIAVLFAIFIIAVFLPTKYSKLFFLFSLIIAGHFIWAFSSVRFTTLFLELNANVYLAKIVSRLGLIGYLLLFSIWHLQEKTNSNFLHIGNMKNTIQFPLIWKGIKEPVWRFVLIFSSMCFGCVLIFVFTVEVSFEMVMYGILFSFVNAILEEIIWRCLILTRLIDLSNEKIALIISTLSFGLYHFSLGFPIWTCLIFAVGGFYMGGVAIKSKGLFAPIIMHIIVNLIFVFIGIIF